MVTDTNIMQPALSGEAMREADRYTIEEIGIPGFTLMESAGRAATEAILDRYGPIQGKHVGCFCGKGNNGGDALVIARQLLSAGAEVTVCLLSPADQLSPDAGKNYNILLRYAAAIHEAWGVPAPIHFIELDNIEQLPLDTYDVIIDGLLGTGVTRPLSDQYAKLVNWINQQLTNIVALDLPTGIHAGTGQVLGAAVQADCTMSMGALKAGLMLGEGPAYAGETEVLEIGIPDTAIRKAARSFQCPYVVTQEAIKSWIPDRKQKAHKYSVGMTLAIAGSEGLSGAATLASQAAARSGAGAVICAAPAQIQPVLASKMTEVMTLGLPASASGVDITGAFDVLDHALSKAASLLIGCGMGRLPDTQQFARTLLMQSKVPTVVDADGLNALIGHTDLIKAHARGHWILTPHLGEFKRLTSDNVDLADIISTVRHYAEIWDCVLILKGAPTVVGAPSGEVFINPTINPAFATAGTGDVLAGLCAGFLAQGLSPVKSALTALFLGGEAANNYTATHHPSTMLASDLINHFSLVLNDYKN